MSKAKRLDEIEAHATFLANYHRDVVLKYNAKGWDSLTQYFKGTTYSFKLMELLAQGVKMEEAHTRATAWADVGSIASVAIGDTE